MKYIRIQRNTLVATVCLLAVSANPSCGVQSKAAKGLQDSILYIPFGKSNEIVVHVSNGTYNVLVEGKQVVTGAYASYDGKSGSMDSRKLAVAEQRSSSFTDQRGKGTLYTIRYQPENGISFQQIFRVYKEHPYFFVRAEAMGKKAAGNYISPFTAEMAPPPGEGDKRALSVPFDNDMWVRYNAHPLREADFTGSEVAAIYNNDTYEGMVIGSTEHQTWKSGVNVQYKEEGSVSIAAFGGFTDSIITHDRNPHGMVLLHDSICASPEIMIGFFDDWRKGMEVYAEANLMSEPPVVFKWNKATPMGWNSWGAIQQKISLQNAKQVVDFFADSCQDFRNEDGTLFIDIDSFWDNMTGGMTGDFSALKAFVDYCHQHHLKPGIYWAPFADWGKGERKMETSDHRYESTWLKAKGLPMDIDGARAMDPTHPGTRARMAYLLNRFKECGFDMIKVDFLGHGAMEADQYYDPAVTTGMQAYKSGMEYLNQLLGKQMLIYAAISPNMATARYVHVRRIGCDAFSAMDNTEYTLNSTGYGWWQSHLYDYIDADHVVFGKETPGANRARMASALVTGTVITGDDFSTNGPWSSAARGFLQNKSLLNIVKDGEAFRPIDANTGNRAVDLFLKKKEKGWYLAAFNYGKKERTFSVSKERLGGDPQKQWRMKELFSGKEILETGNNIEFTLPPGDACMYDVSK